MGNRGTKEGEIRKDLSTSVWPMMGDVSKKKKKKELENVVLSEICRVGARSKGKKELEEEAHGAPIWAG